MEELIIGRWDVLSESYTNFENNVITFTDAFTNPPGDFILEFFTNGTGKFFESGVVSSSFTWTIINENKLAVTFSGAGEVAGEVEISVNESTLTWKMMTSFSYLGIEYRHEDIKVCRRL
jgi:hypothetical protein